MKKILKLNAKWNFYFNGKKEKISVPSNWYLEGFDISGEAVYERKIFLNKKQKDKKYFIVFKGVDYFTEVYINEKFAGKHEGYFQKFRFDITDFIKKGNNTLVVKVNSPKESEDIWPDKKILIKGIFNHHDCRPGSWNKKYGQDKNTGGIWNDVLIEEVDKIEIENVKITPILRDDGKWVVNNELFINNYTEKLINSKIKIDIIPYNFKGKSFNRNYEISLKQGLNKINLFLELDNPELWWT